MFVVSTVALGLLGLFTNIHAQAPTPGFPASETFAKQTAPLTTPIADADLIRVGLSTTDQKEQEYTNTKISANSAYTLTDEGNNTGIFRGQPGQGVTITVNKTGFFVVKPGAASTSGPFKGPLTLKPENSSGLVTALSITRNQKTPSYKGYFEITRGYSSPNKLSLVNVVSLQDYLKAVVPNELPARYGYEAVKAQSVAARNYAIRPREKFWPQFDICDSQYCQVYFGSQTEHATTNKALSETHGLIGLFGGEPILALFSSANGGHSENYENAFSDPKTKTFPDKPIPYLSGRPDETVAGIPNDLTLEDNTRAFWIDRRYAGYDVHSPYARWEKLWPKATITASLNTTLTEACQDPITSAFVSPKFAKGQTIGTLQRVTVLRRGVSGKAMAVEITGSNGKWVIQKEFVIRKVFAHGGRMLPSGNVVFSHLTNAQGDLVTLKANGGGFGHGVGLSQLGASYLSGKGSPFNEIIQHYYRGVAIGSIPLEVGKGRHQQPVKTVFHTEKPSGILYVQTDDTGPVTVSLNGMSLDILVNHVTEKPIPKAVDQLLKTGSQNTLILYPDSHKQNRRIKAWIEVFPPNAADLKAVLAR